MIDSQSYRLRIGCYTSSRKKRRNCLSKRKILMKNPNCYILKYIFSTLLLSFVCSGILFVHIKTGISLYMFNNQGLNLRIKPTVKVHSEIHKSAEVVDHNFEARYINGNIQKQKGIVNMHLNIRSLRNKLFEIKHLVKEHSPHVFGISETELRKDQVDVNELKVPGYDILFPNSWTKYDYARVLVYVKKTFKYTQVHNLQDDRVQSIWLKGGYRNCKEIFFCHAYREHLSRETSSVQENYLSTFLNQWETATYHGGVAEPNEIHISGDINIDVSYGRWLHPDYPLISFSRMIKDICHVCNFQQIVTGITRARYNSITQSTETSCLDHIYTNAKFRCSDPNIISFGNSDHDLIKYIRFSKNPTAPARLICKRSYKGFEKSAFLQDVAAIDWYDVYRCTDVDKATEVFTNKFRYVLNVHAPWVRFQERKGFRPWLTEETKQFMKERDHWKQRAKDLAVSSNSCQAQSHAWENYKKFRNKVNNRKKYEESSYKSERLSEVADCPDILWKNAKSFMGWKSQSSPQQIQVNGTVFTSSRKIAHFMNEYFISKINSIRSAMNAAPFPTAKLKDIMSGKNCKLQLQHVSLAKVKSILKSLSNSRSTSVDELDNFSLKLAADVVAYPIHHIVCLSIIQSKFPEAWKLAKVIPIHKKGDKIDRKNYRPVSILSPLSKVLEKVVYEQIYSYFNRNHIFHPNLHGYRANRSTQTALLQMYDRWVRAANDGKLSGIVFLDLSAAFDLVDPELLISKLKLYRFDDDFISWVRSYLTNRSQAVWIDNTLSEFLHCPVGVPQGSNLGPLFFLVFYNDLPFSVTHCAVDAYADDSTMTVSASSTDIIGDQLTADCETVAKWMVGNKLQLNAEKTHLMTVGTAARLRIQNPRVSVNMGGVELLENQDKCEKLLGCYIEPHIKWQKQVASYTNCN